MLDRGKLEIPTGSPHDIAMMAYRIAEQAMAHIINHERTCSDRWDIQRRTMEALKDTAEQNSRVSASDRKDLRDDVAALEAKATSIIARATIWLLTSMAAGMAGLIWWIVTHKWI